MTSPKSSDTRRDALIESVSAREWLEQQAMSGILEVDSPAGSDVERRYKLPAGTTRCCSTRRASATWRRSPALESYSPTAAWTIASRFTIATPRERLYYGFSVLHYLPVGMVGEDAARTGTVMRPDTLRRYAAAAGFAGCDVQPIDNEDWRFNLLTP
jgi:hypothetical protein